MKLEDLDPKEWLLLCRRAERQHTDLARNMDGRSRPAEKAARAELDRILSVKERNRAALKREDRNPYTKTNNRGHA